MLLCERKVEETQNCVITTAHCLNKEGSDIVTVPNESPELQPSDTSCTFGHGPSDREHAFHLRWLASLEGDSPGSRSCTSTLVAGPRTQFGGWEVSFPITVLNLTHCFIFQKSLEELKKKYVYIYCTNVDVLGPTPSCVRCNYSCWFWFAVFCSSAVVCSQPATTRKSISLVPSCKAFCCPSRGGRL